MTYFVRMVHHGFDIQQAIDTLKHELMLEMVIVSLVILVFLWHIPSAIVLGTEAEPRPPMHPQGLDWYLERWARGRNYSEHKLAGGINLFLAPNLPDKWR